MKLQTTLEGLEFKAYHGIYPEEKAKGGKFIVDVWFDEEVDSDKAMDDINTLINYEKVYDLIAEEMNNRRDLIEDVARNILMRLSHYRLNKSMSIRVKITKINPAGKFGSGMASVSLEL